MVLSDEIAKAVIHALANTTSQSKDDKDDRRHSFHGLCSFANRH